MKLKQLEGLDGFKQMIPGVKYIVIKGNSSFRKGERLWLHNGILIARGGGLYPEADDEDAKALEGLVMELDTKWLQEELTDAKAKVALYEKAIAENQET
jgi:hypothetical protein